MRTSSLKKAVLYLILATTAMLVLAGEDFPGIMLSATITLAALIPLLLAVAWGRRRKLRSKHPELCGSVVFIVPTYADNVLMRPSTRWGGLTPPYKIIPRQDDPQDAIISLLKELGLLDRNIFRVTQGAYIRLRWAGSPVIYARVYVDKGAYLYVAGRLESRWIEDKMIYMDREGIAPVARELLYHCARHDLRGRVKNVSVGPRYYVTRVGEPRFNQLPAIDA
jgi:hypothetical protein